MKPPPSMLLLAAILTGAAGLVVLPSPSALALIALLVGLSVIVVSFGLAKGQWDRQDERKRRIDALADELKREGQQPRHPLPDDDTRIPGAPTGAYRPGPG